MPGKNLRTKGSKNSAKGTMTNTRNGTSRNRSDVVRTSCNVNKLHFISSKV